MNYIDLILLIIIIIFAFLGYRKGLLFSLVYFVRAFVGIPFAFYISNRFSETLYQNYFRDYAISSISDKIDTSFNIDTTIESIKSFIETLPDFITDSLDLSFLNQVSSENAAQITVDNVIEPFAIFLTKILLFIITLLLFYLITGIIIRLIRGLRNRPKKGFIRTTNHFLGAIFGILRSLLFIYIISSIATALINYFGENSNSFIGTLSDSLILQFVTKINFLGFN